MCRVASTVSPDCSGKPISCDRPEILPPSIERWTVRAIDEALRGHVDGLVALVDDRVIRAPTVGQSSLGLPITALIGPQSEKSPYVYRPAPAHPQLEPTARMRRTGKRLHRLPLHALKKRDEVMPPVRSMTASTLRSSSVRLRRRRHSMRTPSAVVSRPANTNAVCRNDASRSNGSSAEIASRGITTA